MDDLTLIGWLRQFKAHNKANPDHGHNCICIDEFSRQLRVAIQEADLTRKETQSVLTALNYIVRSE